MLVVWESYQRIWGTTLLESLDVPRDTCARRLRCWGLREFCGAYLVGDSYFGQGDIDIDKDKNKPYFAQEDRGKDNDIEH